MNPTRIAKVNQVWQTLSDGNISPDFKPEPNLYQQLLHLFMPGEYYYYIIDLPKMSFDYLSPDVTDVLAFPYEDLNVPFMLELIHPEDQPFFIAFEEKVADFFLNLKPEQIKQYKVSYDFRIRRKHGDYIRILQQVITLQTKNEKVVRTLGIHTNISHIKPEGKPTLSFIGLQGQPSYYQIQLDKNIVSTTNGLSLRENQILNQLAQGKLSKEIASELHLSIHTINTHRRNMLEKTGTNNIAELVSLAFRNGWV
jgi:DNA-binding CsgD family transcriptional regulator